MTKRFRLPKDGLVEPEERAPRELTGDDVEGHGLPLTPPPSFGPQRSPGHGGEMARTRIEDEDDVEGHRRPPNV